MTGNRLPLEEKTPTTTAPVPTFSKPAIPWISLPTLQPVQPVSVLPTTGTQWKAFSSVNKNTLFSSPFSGSIATTSEKPRVDTSVSMDDITEQLTKVSIADTVRAALTDTNTNFDELCNQMDAMSVSQFRTNTLKEADLIANRVEADLMRINQMSGEAKTDAESDRRLTVVHVMQSYRRCLELDIEKWKERMRLTGSTNDEINRMKLVIRTFVPWDMRPFTSRLYLGNILEKPESNSIVDQISFVQMALNYWRSAYHYVRDYEKLIGVEPFVYEKELWNLEQTAMSFRQQTTKGEIANEMNYHRLREPRNINLKTGMPMDVKEIQEMIREQQEKAGYKMEK